MRRILWSIVLFSVLANSSVYGQKTSPKQQEVKSEGEVLAAVLRYATLSRKGIVFLRVNGRDPSSETLSLLSARYVRVLPASRAVYFPVPNLAGAWKDVKTGELGSFFEAENVKRISDTRFEMAGGWWQPCGTYTVVFQNSAWSVESYKAGKVCF
jgi:hypothetical protein